MSRDPEAELALFNTLKASVIESRAHCRRSGVTQAERVGLFVTTLRRNWPFDRTSYMYGYRDFSGYRHETRRMSYKPDDPLKLFNLMTDPRFWRDVCVVANPKEHPMINAAAERAITHLDTEEPDHEGSLRVLDGLLASMNVSLQEQQKHLQNLTETREIAARQMQQVAG
jgi:hypothetical protein